MHVCMYIFATPHCEVRPGSGGARVQRGERACGESATVTTQYTHNHLVTSSRRRWVYD
jgi:hypothetical protein